MSNWAVSMFQGLVVEDGTNPPLTCKFSAAFGKEDFRSLNRFVLLFINDVPAGLGNVDDLCDVLCAGGVVVVIRSLCNSLCLLTNLLDSLLLNGSGSAKELLGSSCTNGSGSGSGSATGTLYLVW